MYLLSKTTLLNLLTLGGIVLASPTCFARAAMSGGLGSGVAFTSRHTSLYSNPAGLASGDSKASVYGAYGLDSKNIIGTVTATSGAVGFGGGLLYPQAPDVKLYTGGVAFNLGKTSIGASMNYVNSSLDPSFNAGMQMDLSSMRLAVVVHNLSDINRMDVGLGFVSGPLRFEFDYSKYFYSALDLSWIGAGLVYNMRPISVALGYDVPYLNGSFGDGTIRVALEVAIGQNVAIQAEYNPKLDSSDYLAGLRVKF